MNDLLDNLKVLLPILTVVAVGAGFYYRTDRSSGLLIRYFLRENLSLTCNYGFISRRAVKTIHTFGIDIMYLMQGGNKKTFPNVLRIRKIRESRKVKCPDGHPHPNKIEEK